MSKTAFVTGVAGFVGHATVKRLLNDGWHVVGLDNLNDYYNPLLKQSRLDDIAAHPKAAHFSFHKLDLANRDAVIDLVLHTKPSVIIHLAAQASVRYGLINQQAYLESNLIGHFSILQATKALADAGAPISHLLYASSSSVYGANEKVPFEETDDVSRPVSLYAATKRADEMITHAWSHQFALPASGLRFFTVYGPWGRPDMVPLMFTHAVKNDKVLPLFNAGDLWRDFTYIDDIVEAVVRLIPHAPQRSESKPTPHEIYNLGNQDPVQMLNFVKTLAEVMGKEPVLEMKDWPATEVYRTMADTSKLKAAVGWAPSTPLKDGLTRLWAWYGPWVDAHPGVL
jgi:UDP-glucuronate 4-epimerase